VTTTTDKSVSSTSPAKSVTAASPTMTGPVSKGSRRHYRWNAGQDQTGKETFD
jgi:hypothetical protein